MNKALTLYGVGLAFMLAGVVAEGIAKTRIRKAEAEVWDEANKVAKDASKP